MLLGTKPFLQYWFRLWSSCLPVSFSGVVALLLITAAWTKSFFIIQGDKGTGSWMQVARRADASGEKYLALECCGLAHDLRPSLISGIFTCVGLSVYSQEWTVCGYMESHFVSACALNECIWPPTSHLAYPVIPVPLSTAMFCPHPHPHSKCRGSFSPGWKCPQCYWRLWCWLGL